MGERGDGKKDFGVMMLRGDKLRTLAKLIHFQEVDRIKTLQFSSELERGQYLRDSREAYQKSVDLMDGAAELHQQLSSHHNPSAEEVSLHYVRYIEYFFNTGLRLMWNLHLRIDFIDMVRYHANNVIIPKMRTINERLAANVGGLTTVQLETMEFEANVLVNQLVAFQDYNHQIMINRETPGPRNLSLALLDRNGSSFEKLVHEHQLKLVRERGPEYGGPFEALPDTRKIEVYDDIIQSSGRASVLKDKGSLFMDAVGITILLLTVGLTAWDIYSSEHKLQTIAVNGAQLVGSMVGSFGGEFVGAAAGTAIVATEAGADAAAYVAASIGVEVAAVTSGFLCFTAVATGLGAAIVFGALAGKLVTKFFETGGKHASKVVSVQSQHDPQKPAPSGVGNVRVYVVPMPNGDLLARQLAYQGGSK